MAKKRKYSLRERAILLLGGAIKRNRSPKPCAHGKWFGECGVCVGHFMSGTKKPAPQNKMLSIPENKIVRGEG
jgi:hypothetical protein